MPQWDRCHHTSQITENKSYCDDHFFQSLKHYQPRATTKTTAIIRHSTKTNNNSSSSSSNNNHNHNNNNQWFAWGERKKYCNIQQKIHFFWNIEIHIIPREFQLQKYVTLMIEDYSQVLIQQSILFFFFFLSTCLWCVSAS